ncbi:MAG: hypothetical protein HQ567_20960 [Candidatus Nealsonbacteria bacterium]|nr:hypothetical protein [Candidatus Nealsonbacteria bacterium]
MRYAIVVAFLAFLCSGSAVTGAAPDSTPSAPVDFDQDLLRRRFKAAVEGDFEVVADTVADGPHRYVYWLVTVRPRRTGSFVIRHSCEYEYPKGHYYSNDKGIDREYHFTIGKKNQQRVHHAGGFNYRTFPLACLGDKIVIPIKTHRTLVRHAFATDSLRRYGDGTTISVEDSEERLAKMWSIDKRFARGMGTFAVVNNTPENIRLIKTAGYSFTAHNGRRAAPYLNALFEAGMAGDYNLQWSAKGASSKRKAIPISVVSGDASLTVLANRVEIQDYGEKSRSISTDWFPCEACQLRVGDLLVVEFGQYGTKAKAGGSSGVGYPTIVVDKVPFSSIPVFLVRDRPVDENSRQESRQHGSPTDTDKPRR